MSVSRAQVIALKAHLWPNAARAQGWPVADRARQMDVLSRITGRKIESSNQLTNKEFDLVKRELETLADNLRGAMDTTEAAEGRRYLNIIREEIIPCLALYCDGLAGARAYVSAVIQDKFNKNRRVEKLSLEDLSPHPSVIIRGSVTSEVPSQIQQLLYTFNSRLNGKHGLRNKHGDTVAQMRARAFHTAPDSEAGGINGGIGRAATDLDAAAASTPVESWETASTDPW